jgi:hypothetical protein
MYIIKENRRDRNNVNCHSNSIHNIEHIHIHTYHINNGIYTYNLPLGYSYIILWSIEIFCDKILQKI